VAPWPSGRGILSGILFGGLSVLRASATHAAGGARAGGIVAGKRGEECPEGQAFPPRATLPGEARDCGGTAGRESACSGPVRGSTATLAKRLPRDGDVRS
jgi:hypothetical protein